MTDHIVTIPREYLPAESAHVWRAECSCGFKSANRLTPRQAERDRDAHHHVERFHDHLDACPQCRDHPFALCLVGHELLTGRVA